MNCRRWSKQKASSAIFSKPRSGLTTRSRQRVSLEDWPWHLPLHSLKLAASLPWRMIGWKMNVLLAPKKLLFQGRAVSFREGNRWVYKGATKAKSQNYCPEKFVWPFCQLYFCTWDVFFTCIMSFESDVWYCQWHFRSVFWVFSCSWRNLPRKFPLKQLALTPCWVLKMRKSWGASDGLRSFTMNKLTLGIKSCIIFALK